MELMLDHADLNELREGLSIFPIDGITTNPSILKSALPFEYISHLKEIQKLAGPDRTLHIQLGEMDCESMLREAEWLYSELGREIYLKIPVTVEGLKAIQAIKKQGGHVTATAIYYTMQGIFAIHAGADYLAPYCNRMQNNDIDFCQTIETLRNLIDSDGYESRILGASFKNVSQITQAIGAGAHAVTVQPAMLRTSLSSALVTDAVAAFRKDYERARTGK